MHHAGAIELGLHRELVERLEIRLAELPAHRRAVIAWYTAEVSVVASVHGLHDGPVRDAQGDVSLRCIPSSAARSREAGCTSSRVDSLREHFGT